LYPFFAMQAVHAARNFISVFGGSKTSTKVGPWADPTPHPLRAAVKLLLLLAWRMRAAKVSPGRNSDRDRLSGSTACSWRHRRTAASGLVKPPAPLA
jgi:hypothetical protein